MFCLFSMRIVTTANADYFPGLCLTIASTLAFWKSPVAPRFFVMTTDMPEQKQDALRRMARRVNSDCAVEFYQVGVKDLAKFPPAPGWHPLTYARMLVPDLVEDDRVLYLDSDLLVLRDVGELFDWELGDCIAAAPQAGRLGDDCPWWELDGLDPDAPYFCAGVMVMDCRKWRAEKVSERALVLIFENPAACKCLDQTALNYILHQRVVVLNSAWSRLHWDFARQREEETHILHFINSGKPWKAPSDAGTYGVWLEGFRILCGKDFSILASKFSLLAKRRLVDHFIARGILLALSVGRRLGRDRPDQLKYWQWKLGSTGAPADRIEASHCQQLTKKIRQAAASL